MDSTRILDGKALAARIQNDLARTLAEHKGRPPGLAVVLVGDDPASSVYVRNKQKACAQVGIRTFDHRLSSQTDEAALLSLIDRLNHFEEVDGILVQLPLPPHMDSARVIRSIVPTKDIDGFHPENLGLLLSGTPRFVPCTPAAVMHLLAEAGAKLEGTRSVVVGRSLVVGKPLWALLLRANSTVTCCHSKTTNLESVIREADIVVAACGRPRLIRGSFIRKGAVVIDVGIHRTERGLVGDVVFDEAKEHASAISPVPGGVGPMTIAMLCANTVRARALTG